MKKISFIAILLTFFVFTGFSQAKVTVFEDTVVFDLELGVFQTFESHGLFTTGPTGAGTYTWEKIEIHKPKNWGIEICDTNSCWFDHIFSRSMDLNNADTSILDVHANTNGLEGDSVIVQINIWNDADPSNVLTGVYVFLEDGFTSVEYIKPGDIVTRIYPNPATELISVLSTVDLKEIQVYSILGSKVKVFPYQEGGVYNVRDLNRGMYLVRMVADDGHTVKTLRLNKR